MEYLYDLLLYKYRHFISVLIIVLCFSMSGNAQCHTNNQCVDCFPWCPNSKHLCDEPILKKFCKQTCDTCSPSTNACKSLNCAQRCVLSDDRSNASCACFDGYELDADGRTCTDIDECAWNGTALCENSNDESICKNTEGSFTCVSCMSLGNSKIRNYYNRDECCMRNFEGECGKSLGNHLFSGRNLKIRRWPWTAYLRTGNDFCTGSLITRNNIVTAGSCVQNQSLSSLQIFLGVEDPSEENSVHVQIRSVVQVHIHPEFDFPKNDIAVIELDRPAFLDSNYVSTICLPNGEEPQPGEMCHAVRYGANIDDNDDDDDDESNVLQESALVVIDNNTCINEFANENNSINSTSQFCADNQENDEDSCQNSPGGPLMCQRCNNCDWYLAGVTSIGTNCARTGLSGVYSRVSFFEEWIAGITNQIISPQVCVKASWHQWGPWTQCSVSCGVGRRSRIRFCRNGQAGGPGCIGSRNEITNCNAAPCSDWSHWGQCSATCGNGTRTRSRGEETESKPCSSTALCQAWGEFGEWGDCSLTCGGGTRRSFRECLNGSPGEGECLGSSQRQETCNTHCCPSWSEFSPFSNCSASCGGGIMTSSRTCRCGEVGDVGCEGSKTRTVLCGTEECPGFSQWTEFDSCSAECDGGVRIRTRTCSKPDQCVPDEHGIDTEQIKICNTRPCGTWGAFGEYGSCSVSCGEGTQSRNRECIGETSSCIGSNTEERSCNMMKCPTSKCKRLSNLRSDTSCCSFAKQGFCSLYEKYMMRNCAKTCCEYKPGQPCISRDCINILGNRACSSLSTWCSHSYVHLYCKATCGLC